jgi:predicted ATPase
VSDLRALYEQQIAERGFRPDPIQAAIIDRLDDLRARLIAAREAEPSLVKRWFGALGSGSTPTLVRGIYLWGGVGRGKTWLMDLFFQSLPFAEKRRRHFHRFMHDVHSELKALQQRAAPLDLVADRIAEGARVLCFDELFVSDIADAMILGGLFAALFKRGVTLVATSNLPPGDLYKSGLQRQRFLPTIELLEQEVDVVAVDGATDYRLRRLTQAGTYLPSDAPDTPRRLDQLFDELADHDGDSGTRLPVAAHPSGAAPSPGGTQPLGDAEPTGMAQRPGAPTPGAVEPSGTATPAGGARPKPAINQSGRPWPSQPSTAGKTIDIEGRPIPVVRASGGVVWFDFMALCSGPRSQNDYIEIARNYQSVIVSDVPIFDSLHEDEARRFIALVDELYDRNVNLILSAAAPPTDLYRGDRVGFQFERTASRLIEMQSEEYLAREHKP